MKIINKFRSIWWCWIIVTVIYIIFTLPLSDLVPSPIVGFVGLFAPYGFLSILYFVFNIYYNIAALFIFIVGMVVTHKYINNINISLGKMVIINLLILCILTGLVDIMRLTPAASWKIFISGGNFSKYLDEVVPGRVR